MLKTMAPLGDSATLLALDLALEVARRVKYKGVRKRTSGRYVAEIRDPSKKPRFWIKDIES